MPDNVEPIGLGAYIPGSLKITRLPDGRFQMEGNYMVGGNRDTDHLQLIYEALEIAASSNDKYASQFRAMCDEQMDLTKDWDD